MKKKTLLCVMVAAAMLAAPSCIKNDEPVGIEEMRKGKAELLKAEAAVQLAEAKIKEAQVAYQEALTRQQEAIAAYKEAEAELKKLGVELEQAKNDKEKAQYAADIAKIEQRMALDAEVAKGALLNAQAQTATAEIAYQTALAQLQAWMVSGPDGVYTAALGNLITQLTTSRTAIATYQKNIADATAQLYNAQTDEKKWVSNQKIAIATAEKEVAVYTDLVAYWTALSEANDVKWAEELKAAQDKAAAAGNKIVELQEAEAKARNALAPFTAKKNEAKKPYAEAVALSIPVSKDLTKVFGDDFDNAGWKYDELAGAYTYNLSADYTNYKNVEKVLDMLVLNADENDTPIDGLIFDLRSHVLSGNNLAVAQQDLASAQADAAATAKTHTDNVAAFNKALKAFKDSAAVYKFDWTKAIVGQKTLRDEVNAAIDEFNKIESPKAGDVMAIVERVSKYVKTRSAFDANIDAKITTADGKEMLTSDYMVSDAAVAQTYVNSSCAMLKTLTAAEITDANLTDPKTVTGALTDASFKAFGLGAWVLTEIKADEFQFYTSDDSYLEFINPIKVYTAPGNWMNPVQIGAGSLFNSLIAKAKSEELALELDHQTDIATVVKAAEDIYKEYKDTDLAVEKAVAAIEVEETDAQNAVEEATAAVNAATSEYNLYVADVTRIQGYINQGYGETDTTGTNSTIVIVADVKGYVDTLNETLIDETADLEKAQNLMKVYEETGFTSDVLNMIVAYHEAQIENAKTQLAIEQAKYEKLVAQKDQLLELLKNE